MVKEVFAKIKLPCIIAGLNPSDRLRLLCSKYEHIILKENLSHEELQTLIKAAHINLLTVPGAATGIKLKLLNVLFNGRHCLVNKHMIANTGLESCSHIKETPQNFIDTIYELWDKPLDENIINARKKILLDNFSNTKNAKTLIAQLLAH